MQSTKDDGFLRVGFATRRRQNECRRVESSSVVELHRDRSSLSSNERCSFVHEKLPFYQETWLIITGWRRIFEGNIFEAKQVLYLRLASHWKKHKFLPGKVVKGRNRRRCFGLEDVLEEVRICPPASKRIVIVSNCYEPFHLSQWWVGCTASHPEGHRRPMTASLSY